MHGISERPGHGLLVWLLAAIVLVVADGQAEPEPVADEQAIPVADEQAERVARQAQLLTLLSARQQASTPYVVIDTRGNRLRLHDGQHRVLRDAICATGAPRRFEGPKAYKHNWVFSTPTGRFRVLRKVTDPIWTRPEWDFLEAGEEIPVFAEDPRRFQRGILGSHAIYFLRDIMIHGTLYEINLGRNITHGCVRVAEADLVYLYEHVETGWPVYVY